jgi:ubiquinone/menaquinone biosynthesis C-methylase UbiE
MINDAHRGIPSWTNRVARTIHRPGTMSRNVAWYPMRSSVPGTLSGAALTPNGMVNEPCSTGLVWSTDATRRILPSGTERSDGTGANLLETEIVNSEAAYWDSQAATFDEQPDHGLRVPRTREAWLRLLLGHLPAAPAAIADLGCGTGSLTVLLAGAGYTVTGLDIAPQMIKAARAKARAARVSARFVTSDAAAPTLPPASFDAVLARHVLWAMPDHDAALTEWIRLLRPDGALVLVEGSWHTGAGLTAESATAAVRRQRAEAAVTMLDDPVLWGGPITDERYLLASARLGGVRAVS